MTGEFLPGESSIATSIRSALELGLNIPIAQRTTGPLEAIQDTGKLMLIEAESNPVASAAQEAAVAGNNIFKDLIKIAEAFILFRQASNYVGTPYSHGYIFVESLETLLRFASIRYDSTQMKDAQKNASLGYDTRESFWVQQQMFTTAYKGMIDRGDSIQIIRYGTSIDNFSKPETVPSELLINASLFGRYPGVHYETIVQYYHSSEPRNSSIVIPHLEKSNIKNSQNEVTASNMYIRKK